MPQLRYEQAVYGSFPFWHRGYDLLAQSPGCRPEWLDIFKAACQGYGEPSRSGDDPAGAVFVLPPADRKGVWMIVGVCPQGADDLGRPGALAFHGLFVDAGEFRRAACDPFTFTPALRCDWTAETTALPVGWLRSDPEAPSGFADLADDPEAARLAAALARGRRVALESSLPLGDLARRAWGRLPDRCRARLSVATLALGNAHRFDLLVVPRLAAIELDPSYLTADDLSEPPPTPGSPWWSRLRSPRALAYAALSFAFLAIASWLVLRGRDGEPIDQPPATTAPTPDDRPDTPAPPTSADDRPPPDRSAFRSAPPIDDDTRMLVADGLLDLAGRFGVTGALDRGALASARNDPAPLMARIASDLRYHGPTLTASERARLASEPGGARALDWHEHLRHYADDRPLPADFADGPLPWQLAVLAWSFRVDPHPHLAPAEVPFALADALSAPWPVRPTPLADRYPALASYARFLARLPRR